MKQELPDRYLGCYAYSLYREPPVVVDHLEENLIVGDVGFSTYVDDRIRTTNPEEWLAWNKLARLLRDPYQEVDPLVEDYCRAAYGPGAEAMMDYSPPASRL